MALFLHEGWGFFNLILFLLVHRTSLQHCWHLSTRCLGLREKFK